MTAPHLMTIEQINEMTERAESLSMVEKHHLTQAIYSNKDALRTAMYGAYKSNNMGLMTVLFFKLKNLENGECREDHSSDK